MTYKNHIPYAEFVAFKEKNNLTEGQAVAELFPGVGWDQVLFVFESSRFSVTYIYRGKLFIDRTLQEFNSTFKYKGRTSFKPGILLNVEQKRY